MVLGYPRAGEDNIEFDKRKYDPTTHGGGHDIQSQCRRPLPPPNSFTLSKGDFDYDRLFADLDSAGELIRGGYRRRVRHKLHLLRKCRSRGGVYLGIPQPAHGPETEYGRRPEYQQPPWKYGSGYGREPEYDGGYGYGRKPEYQRYELEYIPGYGCKHEYGEPESEYGSGYGRKPQFKQPESEYGSGYGRKLEYAGAVSESGSGYGQRTEYGRPSGYGGRRESDCGSVYGRSEEQDYPGPSYGGQGDEGCGHGGDSSYGSNGCDSSYGRDGGDPSNDSDGGEESYGRKKYIILKKNMRKITTTRTSTKRKKTVETADLFLMVMMP